MRRFAVLSLVMGVTVMVLATPASAAPSLNASPGSGPPGTVIAVNGAEFSPGFECNLHLGALSFPPNNDSGLVGTCSVNGSGVLTGSFTVPDSSVGNYNLWACNGFASTPCSDEFVEKASTPFSIELPTTTTTTTPVITAPPVTTPLVTVPSVPILPLGSGCDIPSDAIVVDFDDITTGVGFRHDDANAILAVDEFYTTQFDHIEMTGPSASDRLVHLPLTETSFTVTDAPATVVVPGSSGPFVSLGTTSPPNALRFFDEGHFSVPAYRALTGEMSYFGFNVGFGHYTEGFERPDEIVLEVNVRLLPYHELDGSITEGSWPTVSVTLGPGPQPVTTCIIALNTAGIGHPLYSTWLVDVYPKAADGSALHVPIGIDDVFYGSSGIGAIDFDPGDLTPVPATVPLPAAVTTVTTLDAAAAEEDAGSDALLFGLLALGGVIVGAGAMLLLRRRP